MQHSDSRTKATAHSGILRAAKGVVEDIVREGVLAALMEGQPVPPSNRKTQDCRLGTPWWSLAHSLACLGAFPAFLLLSSCPRCYVQS